MQQHKFKQYKETFAMFDAMPNSAFVRLPIVKGLLGVSAATVWRSVKNGYIPKPYKLTSRTTAWNVGELRKALTIKDEV